MNGYRLEVQVNDAPLGEVRRLSDITALFPQLQRTLSGLPCEDLEQRADIVCATNDLMALQGREYTSLVDFGVDVAAVIEQNMPWSRVRVVEDSPDFHEAAVRNKRMRYNSSTTLH